MKFYTKNHKFYCGIDLHARSMYICILDAEGRVMVHKDIKTEPSALENIIRPYACDLVIGVECMFSWYWVSDFCNSAGIPFILKGSPPPTPGLNEAFGRRCQIPR